MTGEFSALCLDLFLLAHAHLEAGEAGDGPAFERRIRRHLRHLELPVAGGIRVFTDRSQSGLYHQIDEQTDCGPALVVGEWKAHRGVIPKNDLLRFKAATDDYWMSTYVTDGKPVMRVFGGTGRVTLAMRSYAAHAGIALITPDRWPISALCDPHLLWASAGLEPPKPADVRSMVRLVRPMQHVLNPRSDGGWFTPPATPPDDLARREAVWFRHSERAWAWWDDQSPSRFEALVAARCRPAQQVA